MTTAAFQKHLDTSLSDSVTEPGSDDSFDKSQQQQQTSGRRRRVIVVVVASVVVLALVATTTAITSPLALRRKKLHHHHRPHTTRTGNGTHQDNIDSRASQAPSEAPLSLFPDEPVVMNDEDTDTIDATESWTDRCGFSNLAPALPGKKGIGMKLEGEVVSERMELVRKLRPYWNYSWGLQRMEEQPDNIEFIPMVFGDARTVSELKSELQAISNAGKARRIMAFNEPDAVDQANMVVDRALDRWPLLSSIDLPIIGPSCRFMRGNWIQTFMQSAATNCKRVDYMGVHWYGDPDPELFKATMTSLFETHQRPLMITEFAPADWDAATPHVNRFSPSEVLAFAKEVIPWLERTDWIAGYAWFPFQIDNAVGTSSALFYKKGWMTALGRYYASVSTDTPYGDQTIEADF